MFGNINIFENPWGKEKESDRINQAPKKTKDEAQDDIERIIKIGKAKFIEMLNAKKKKNSNANNSNGSDGNIIGFIPVIAILFVLSSVWLLTGFYTVEPYEQGVVIRFGKYNRISMPGLNYKFPAPIETVEILPVTSIKREVIGTRELAEQMITARNPFSSIVNMANVTMKNDQNTDPAETSIEKESRMLTGDENIMDMHFFIHWRIDDPKSYVFNIKDDARDSTVKIVGESAMRQIVGQSRIADALSEQRQQIEMKAGALIQEVLDNYNAGITIDDVGILYSYVAQEVRDAYRDVQSAKADQERVINEAYAFRNDILPRARGMAEELLQNATAYKGEVIANANGEAGRFKSILQEYEKAGIIIKDRMYIDTMSEVLSPINKIILDAPVSKNSLPILSITDMMEKNNKKQQ